MCGSSGPTSEGSGKTQSSRNVRSPDNPVTDFDFSMWFVIFSGCSGHPSAWFQSHSPSVVGDFAWLHWTSLCPDGTLVVCHLAWLQQTSLCMVPTTVRTEDSCSSAAPSVGVLLILLGLLGAVRAGVWVAALAMGTRCDKAAVRVQIPDGPPLEPASWCRCSCSGC